MIIDPSLVIILIPSKFPPIQRSCVANKRMDQQTEPNSKEIAASVEFQQIKLGKSRKMFYNHPLESEQNQSVTGNIHSTQKKLKQTVKHKLRICSTTFGFDISSLILY